MTDIRKVGIIGIGPRGGYASERLILELTKQKSLSNIHLSLFESTGNFGNGQVYNLQQNSSNWINITERILELNRREAIETSTLRISSFPSYHEWIEKDFNTLPIDKIDTYPPRAYIGKYLSQRFQSLAQPLIDSNIVSLYNERVKEVIWLNNNKIQITTISNTYVEFDEILLTIGHQFTELSQQIKNWSEFVDGKTNINLFKAPYPVADYLYHENLSNKSVIGIRGFGLAMIDVVRAIAEKFGRFVIEDKQTQSCSFRMEEETINMLIPFSLDGLPPAPKPLNARVDKWFEPPEEAILNFEQQIRDKQIQEKAKNPHFLIAAFAPIATAIYSKLPNAINPLNTSKSAIEDLIIRWLEDQSYEHPVFTPSQQPARKSMEEFVEMAIGQGAISLNYCIGQVWRHCQPSIYKELSFNNCSDSVFAKIIALDESTKRYSYGPPVESIQQLLALIEAGVLNLDFVNDPILELTKEGWRFHLDSKSIIATIMIDSVLDAPQIKSVTSSIVKNMLVNDLIKVVHNNLGVETDECGYLISQNKNKKIPIALLGRLAKGTIIGVDAILECFGSRPRQWAKQAAKNHIDWLNKN